MMTACASQRRAAPTPPQNTQTQTPHQRKHLHDDAPRRRVVPVAAVLQAQDDVLALRHLGAHDALDLARRRLQAHVALARRRRDEAFFVLGFFEVCVGVECFGFSVRATTQHTIQQQHTQHTALLLSPNANATHTQTKLPPLTGRVDDREVGAVLVLDAHDHLLGPELLLRLEALVLGGDIFLQLVERDLDLAVVGHQEARRARRRRVVLFLGGGDEGVFRVSVLCVV